jgi:hypothetical protein
MAAINQTGFPSYANTHNVTGSHAGVKNAGRVKNAEQNRAVASLEKAGRLDTSKYDNVAISREVDTIIQKKADKVEARQEASKVADQAARVADEQRTADRIEQDVQDDHTQKVQRVEDQKSDDIKAEIQTQAQEKHEAFLENIPHPEKKSLTEQLATQHPGNLPPAKEDRRKSAAEQVAQNTQSTAETTTKSAFAHAGRDPHAEETRAAVKAEFLRNKATDLRNENVRNDARDLHTRTTEVQNNRQIQSQLVAKAYNAVHYAKWSEPNKVPQAEQPVVAAGHGKNLNVKA